MATIIDVKTVKAGFWHMPKTFYAVLFIEFWERFAFYGLQSVAVIYFVKKFGMLEFVRSGRVAITKPMKTLNTFLKEVENNSKTTVKHFNN